MELQYETWNSNRIMKRYILLILLLSFLVITFLWKDEWLLLPKQEEPKMFTRRIEPDEYQIEKAPIKESTVKWYHSLKEELTGLIGLINISLLVLERVKNLKRK